MPEEQIQAALKNPLYSDIVRGTGDLTPMGADVAQVVRSGCSALAHGDAFGTLSILDGRSWPKPAAWPPSVSPAPSAACSGAP
jgi:hypothetical protein